MYFSSGEQTEEVWNKKRNSEDSEFLFDESDRRGSNPRSRPWQGRALPTTPLSHLLLSITVSCEQIIIYYGRARLSTYILNFFIFFQMYLLFPKIP